MLSRSMVTQLVREALAEDAPWGDITAESVIPAGLSSSAALVSRNHGVFSGAQVFTEVFTQQDAGTEVCFAIADGDQIAPGQQIATIEGPARAVLTAERIGLNFVQRMSGISTLTKKYVDATAGTKARIVDTRKTTPGLRILEKYAVRCGGGYNHRFGLSDAVMLKDNHLAILGSHQIGLSAALRELRDQLGHTVHIEVEIDRLDQLDDVLAGGVDTIMLDNFSFADLAEGVRRIEGRTLVEASGNVSLRTVADIAATGVDLISVGALTHSAPSIDLGLDIECA